MASKGDKPAEAVSPHAGIARLLEIYRLARPMIAGYGGGRAKELGHMPISGPAYYWLGKDVVGH